MPIQRCTISKARGYRWGKRGKCYRSKSKALRQARAIKASQARRGKSVSNRRAPNPVRLDPTRTTTLRRQFVSEVTRRFNLFRKALKQLIIDEDAFGIRDYSPFTENVLGDEWLAANGDFSSSQVTLDDPTVKAEIEDMQGWLNPQDVIELEYQPHVTVRYGLHTLDPNDVYRIVKDYGNIWLRLGRLSLFETEDQDVLKLEVESQQLEELNRLLSLLPHTDTHLEYQPHLTIAYLKPGTGRKYLTLPNYLEGTIHVFQTVWFSDPQRNQVPLITNYNPGQPRDKHGRWTKAAAPVLSFGEFWHGTSSDLVKSIRENGIKPKWSYGADQWGARVGIDIREARIGGRPASVYFTKERYTALDFGRMTASLHNANPVVIKVRMPVNEWSNVVPDELADAYLRAFRYPDTVKPEWIDSIWTYENGDFVQTSNQSEDGVFYIVIPIIEEVENYDPSQPRDKYGRWTGVGGGVSLSQSEISAIESWWSGGYEEIQEAVRSGRDHPEAKHLDSAIEKSKPIQEDITLYRGISVDPNGDLAKNMRKGFSFSDTGFVALTGSRDVAERFATGGDFDNNAYILKVTVPKGVKALDIPSGIAEMLLRRGASGRYFKITSMKKRRGTNTFDVEAVYVDLK